MSTVYATPITVTSELRGEILAARARDGVWEYEVERGRCTVTHVATGRRYWDLGLDYARMATHSGRAARFLQIGQEPRPGRPMVRGEHRAICGELTAANARVMVLTARAAEPVLVDAAVERIRPGLGLTGLTGADADKVLGVVYGRAPGLWLEALRAVRPDLVPLRHRRAG